jgi:TolB-like protein
MRRFVRVAMAMTLASIALITPAIMPAQAKPVVAVLYFDNTSIGKDRADYDGVGKGIAELMINDLLANPNLRVVERERIQALLTEQNLVKSGAVDAQTAIKLGRMIGAQYMITGAFMSDGRGNYVLTGRTINVENSVIGNPTRINTKGDDVLGMIAQLTAKMNAEMKLPALRTGDAGGAGAVPAGQPAAAATGAQTSAEAKTATRPADAKTVAKPADAKPATQVAQAKPAGKMDMKTAMLYSKALEEEDAGNKAKALELYRQVGVKFPNFAPVESKISKLSRA